MQSSWKRKLFFCVLGVLCATITLLVYGTVTTWEKLEPDVITTQGSQVWDEFQAKRKIAISNSDVRKVFIFSYMKGGSSIFGKMFDTDPRSILWYEPLDSFFSHVYATRKAQIPLNFINWANGTRRVTSREEKLQLQEFLSGMLECDVYSLPLETMTQPFFLQQSSALAAYCSCAISRRLFWMAQTCFKGLWNYACGTSAEESVNQGCPKVSQAAKSIIKGSDLPSATKQLKAAMKSEGLLIYKDIRQLTELFARREQCFWKVKKEIQSCLEIAEDSCSSSTLRVLEINRMKMEDMDFIIKAFPGVYYFYYTRDPRAISLSRSKGGLKVVKNDTRAITEARYLCPRMFRDVVEFRMLERKYPGLVHHVRYEDFVANPVFKSEKVYSLLGDTPPVQWMSFVESNMHAEKKSKYQVVDANDTANKWMHVIPTRDLWQMDDLCGKVLDALGYPRYSSLAR